MNDFNLTLSRPFTMVENHYGGSQMWYETDRKIKTGCGPVALANLVAYESGQTYSQKEMLALQNKVWSTLKGPVVSPLLFLRAMKKELKNSNTNFSTKLITLRGVHGQKPAQALQFIAQSLAHSHPVPALFGPNAQGKESYKSDFHNHWVLVTGLKEKDDLPILTVSSWGNAYDLDFYALLESKWFVSFIRYDL